MLVRASFENYKALKAVEVDLTPFTVLVGKNGSGKTSVLHGIHHVTQLPMIGKGVREEPYERVHRILGGDNDPHRLYTPDADGLLRIALYDNHSLTLSLGVQFYREPDGDDEIVNPIVGLTGHPSQSITEATDDQRAARALLTTPAARSFGSAAFLRLDAAVMVEDSVPSSEEPQLAHDGAGLASVLAYLAGAEPERLAAIRNDLAAVVPQIRAIRTFPAKVRRRRYDQTPLGFQAVDEEIMGHRFALDMGAGRLIPADLLSEGTVLALGFITALRHPSCPRLVLMDDIDGALHSSAQVELVRCLRAILRDRPDVQVVCTTHSPDLLDQVDLAEVRVMALDKEGHAHCAKLADHPESERWRKMLRTGEFWASVGEDWVLGAARDAA
jgi:hypothetical protein